MREIKVNVPYGAREDISMIQVSDARTNRPLSSAEKIEFWRTLEGHSLLTSSPVYFPAYPGHDEYAQKLKLLMAYKCLSEENKVVIEKSPLIPYAVIEAASPISDTTVGRLQLPQILGDVFYPTYVLLGGFAHHADDGHSEKERKGVSHYAGEYVTEQAREICTKSIEDNTRKEIKHLGKRSGRLVRDIIEGSQADVDGLMCAGLSPERGLLKRAKKKVVHALEKKVIYDADLSFLRFTHHFLPVLMAVQTAIDLVSDVKTIFRDNQRISALRKSRGLPSCGLIANSAKAVFEGSMPYILGGTATVAASPWVGIPTLIGAKALFDDQRHRDLSDLEYKLHRQHHCPDLPFDITVTVEEIPVPVTLIASTAEPHNLSQVTTVSTTPVEHVEHPAEKPPSTITSTRTAHPKVNVDSFIPSLLTRLPFNPLVPKVVDWQRVFRDFGRFDPERPPRFMFTDLYNDSSSRVSDPPPDVGDRLMTPMPRYPQHGSISITDKGWKIMLTDPRLVALGLTFETARAVHRKWFADSAVRVADALGDFQKALRNEKPWYKWGWQSRWDHLSSCGVSLDHKLEEVITEHPENSSIWRAVRLAHEEGRNDLIAACQWRGQLDKLSPEQLEDAFRPVLRFCAEYGVKIWQSTDFSNRSTLNLDKIKRCVPDALNTHLYEAEYYSVQANLAKDSGERKRFNAQAKQALDRADRVAKELDKIERDQYQAALDRDGTAAFERYSSEGLLGRSVSLMEETRNRVQAREIQRALTEKTGLLDGKMVRLRNAKTPEEQKTAEVDLGHSISECNALVENLAGVDAEVRNTKSAHLIDAALVIGGIYAEQKNFAKAEEHLTKIARTNSEAKIALDCVQAAGFDQDLSKKLQEFKASHDPAILVAMNKDALLLRQKGVELQSSADKRAQDLGKRYGERCDAYLESVQKSRVAITDDLRKQLDEVKEIGATMSGNTLCEQVTALEQRVAGIVAKIHEFNPEGQPGSQDLVLDTHLELADVYRKRNDVASTRKHLVEASTSASLPVHNQAEIERARLDHHHNSGVVSIVADVGFLAADRVMTYFARQAMEDPESAILPPAIAGFYLENRPLISAAHAVGVPLWRVANLRRFQENQGGSLLQGITRENLRSVLWSAAGANAASQLALYWFDHNDSWYGQLATLSAHSTQTALSAWSNFQHVSEALTTAHAGLNILTASGLPLATRVSMLKPLATISTVNSVLNVVSLAGNVFTNIDANRRLLGKRIWDGNKMILVKDTAGIVSTGTLFGGAVYAGGLAIGSPVSVPVYAGSVLIPAAIHAGTCAWERYNYGNAGELFHNAHVALRENSVEEALKLAAECVRKAPHRKDYQVFYRKLLANQKLNQGEFAEVKRICDSALVLHVDADYFLMSRAQSLLGLGKMSEAISDFRRVVDSSLSDSVRGAALQYLTEIAIAVNPREIPYSVVNDAAGAVNAVEREQHAVEWAAYNYSNAVLSPVVDWLANNRVFGPVYGALNLYPNCYLRYRDDREKMATLGNVRKQYAMRYQLLDYTVQLNALWRHNVNSYNRWNYFFDSHRSSEFEHEREIRHLAQSGFDPFRPLFGAGQVLNLIDEVEHSPFLKAEACLHGRVPQANCEREIAGMVRQKMGGLEQRLAVLDEQMAQPSAKVMCLLGGKVPEFEHERAIVDLAQSSYQTDSAKTAMGTSERRPTAINGGFFTRPSYRHLCVPQTVTTELSEGLNAFGLFATKPSAIQLQADYQAAALSF